MGVALALAAALCYACGSVIEHQVARQQRPELALRLGLLVALARQPLWVIGFLVGVGAYGLEAAALAVGNVMTVAPLLVSGLLFALPLASHRSHRRMTSGEWAAAVALTGALAVFVTVGGADREPLRHVRRRLAARHHRRGDGHRRAGDVGDGLSTEPTRPSPRYRHGGPVRVDGGADEGHDGAPRAWRARCPRPLAALRPRRRVGRRPGAQPERVPSRPPRGVAAGHLRGQPGDRRPARRRAVRRATRRLRPAGAGRDGGVGDRDGDGDHLTRPLATRRRADAPPHPVSVG